MDMRSAAVRATGQPSGVATSGRRVDDETGFVLHAYPYRETSLIVDVFTRTRGRVSLVARGARRPRSALRGVLMAFRPLTLCWVAPRSAGVEVGTLSRAEWVGGIPGLQGEGLVCGFYLNELLIKLLARDDAHEGLFDGYAQAIAALAQREASPAPLLRAFEMLLLRETGYAPCLGSCADTGRPIEAGMRYRYLPEIGPVAAENSPAEVGSPVVDGKTLRDIERGDYSDGQTLIQSKLLMRQILNHHLGGQILHTRQMMVDLQDF